MNDTSIPAEVSKFVLETNTPVRSDIIETSSGEVKFFIVNVIEPDVTKVQDKAIEAALKLCEVCNLFGYGEIIGNYGYDGAMRKDFEKNLKEDNLILNAINSGKNSYYIVLPDMINNKVVASYFADLRSVGETPTSDENTTANEEIKEQETEITQAEENLEQNSETTTEVAQMEKKPGEKIYLTATEIEEQKLTLTVKYDEKEKNGEKLYNKQLEQIVEGKNISVKGYMPADATISVKTANEEKTKETLKDILNNDITYQIAYDIKLLSNEKEYIC